MDSSYHQIYYEHFGIDLLRQTNTSTHPETGKLEGNDSAVMFFFFARK